MISIYLPMNFVLMYMIVQILFFPMKNLGANNSEFNFSLVVCVAVEILRSQLCGDFNLKSQLCSDFICQ